MKAKAALVMYSLQALAFSAYSQQHDWSFKVGSPWGEEAVALGTDKSNNLYVTGRYSGTVDFDPSPSTANLTGSGTFIAKYSASGAYLWAKKIEPGAYVNAMRIDTDGYIILNPKRQYNIKLIKQ